MFIRALSAVSLTCFAGLIPVSAQIAAPNKSQASLLFSGKPSGDYIRRSGSDRVIVFVNGIFGDAVSTWTNADGAYWPRMIATDPAFDGTDIYVHSFQSPKISTAQQIVDLASRLRDFLEVDGVLSHKKIVFLAHSMGGLVTRAMIVNYRPPATKIPMIFFFATPTAGAEVAAIASHVSENPQLRDMLPLSDGGYVKTLREQWLQTSDDSGLNYPNAIASYCAYELKNTIWHVRIVNELSATYLCNRTTHSVVTDHIGIVKPKDERDDSYVFFKAAFERTFAPGSAAFSEALATSELYAEATRTPLFLGPAYPLFSQSKKYIEVGYEKGTQEGEITTHVELTPSERITGVQPVISNAVNVKSARAAVVRFGDGSATVRYAIRGLPGGHADLVVNYLIEARDQDRFLK